jgi:hypothetical protein
MTQLFCQTKPHAAALLLTFAFAASACGSDETTPSPTPGFKPQVTILAPQGQAQATATPAAATAPTPLPAETPSNVTQPQPLPAGSNPFTGLPLAQDAKNRRPILVKVANTVEVRPQTGLQAADVVVEHYAEGGITRFTVLFLGNAPEKVGSVRSCRLIDKELPTIFDAALVCSGMSGGVKEALRDSAVHVNGYTMISDFGQCENPGFPQAGGCPLFRDPPDFSYAPHNLWAHVGNGWAELDKRGKNHGSGFGSWVFSAAAPAQGIAVSSVNFQYEYGMVGWAFDTATGLWTRSLGGQTWVDKATSTAITAANIIAIETPHITTLIVEDKTGARSIEIQLWGEGPAKFFRDGKLVFGKWQRTAQPGVLNFFDGDGKPFALKPGNTWLQVVPPELVIQAK